MTTLPPDGADERLQRLVDQLPMMALVVNERDEIVAVNALLCARLGHQPDALRRAPLSRLQRRSAAERRDQPRVGRLLGAGPREEYWEVVRCDDQLRQVHVRSQTLDAHHALLLLDDVTGQRGWASENARYRRVVELNMDLILVTDQSGAILFANDACHRLLGVPALRFVGMSLFDLVHPSDLALLWQLYEELLETRLLEPRALRLIDSTHAVRHVRCKLSSLRNPYTLSLEVLLIGRDDTEQHQLQQALIESQKMEGMGRLARGIAHDFNNLLQLIIGSVQCIDDEGELSEEVQGWHETIRSAAERGHKLVEQLQAFSRRDVGLRLPHTVAQILLDFSDLVRPVIASTIEFSQHIACPQSIIEVDSGQVVQMLFNLVINAREALADQPRGALDFSATLSIYHDRECVCFSVRDSGCGIPPEHLSRIFEPFFSTKDNRRGAGLGLAVAYGIVEAHRGHIEVDSTPGVGSTFNVFLPLAPPGLHAIIIEQPQRIFGHEELVLAVDDEPMQRKILSKQLEYLNYNVLAAEDGAHAIDLFSDYADEIECVLLDVVMPRLDGREALTRLLALRPDLPVIITSGLGNDEAANAMLAEGARAFLPKPFKIERLGAVLRQILDPKTGLP